MSAKDSSCIDNDKVMVSVKNEKLIKVNLITTVRLLSLCYGQHKTTKLSPKSVLTPPVNICYHNVKLKVLSIKKAHESTD